MAEESKGSTEYTPGLMEIRDAVTDWLGVDAFDRWLAVHDAELVRVRDERIAEVRAYLERFEDPEDQAVHRLRPDEIRSLLSAGDPDGE